MKTACALATLFSVASAHNSYPAGSGFPSEESCRSMSSDVQILSHHIHLFQNKGSLFTGDQVEQPEELAEDIQQRMKAALNITETCQSWIGYDSVRCGFNIDEGGWELVPALPDRNWAYSILPSDFGAAVQWIQKNRCIEYTPEPSDDPKFPAPKHEPLCFDIFIHPNTGCFINDHHEWGMWIGDPHTVLDIGFSPCLYGCGPSSQPGCNPGVGLGDERMMCLVENEAECLSSTGDGLGVCMVQNDCIQFDEEGDLNVLALTSCIQRIPIVNPNPVCGDKLDLAGALDCVGSCEGGDDNAGCIIGCLRDSVDIAPGLSEILACSMGDGVCSDKRGFGVLPCNEDGSVAGIDLCCDGYAPLGELFPDTKPEFPDKGCLENGNLLCGVDFVSQPPTQDGSMRRDTWANIMEAARTKPNTIDSGL